MTLDPRVLRSGAPNEEGACAMPSQQKLSAFVERLEADGELAAAMELDAVTTLRDMGFADLVATVEQERDRIGELVDRIYRDAEFRGAVEQDPIAHLADWGIPEVAMAPVLVLAGAPDDVVERATADVEAHLLGRKPATLAAMAAVLGTLAFAQQAAAGTQTAQASPQVAPAALAQVSPATLAQVAPAAQAQVAPAAKAQVSKAAQARWQGVQAHRLQAQGLALLRAQGTGL
jgi:hypothetical protein